MYDKYQSFIYLVENRKREFNSQPKEDWLLKDYLAYLENYINSGYPKEQRCLYLKDWHLTRLLLVNYIQIVFMD